MRVLVTGATGCLGGATALRLALDGADVTASGRRVDAGARLLAAEPPRLRFQPAELTDARAIDRLVEGHDVVVHCGALSSTWGPPAAFQLANVEGTRHVVYAAERHNVRRLVFLSTPSVYSRAVHQVNVSESDPLPDRALNAYAASKRQAERIVADAHARGLGTVTLRPRAIFGPGDTALLPRLLRVAARGWLPLVDSGTAVVDLTYVDNVVDAVVAAVRAPTEVDGHTYNISNGEPWTVAVLLKTIAATFGLDVRLVPVPFGVAYAAATALELLARLQPAQPEPLLTRAAVHALGRSQTLSIEAARRDLAYHPSVSVSEGITRTAAWWTESRPC